MMMADAAKDLGTSPGATARFVGLRVKLFLGFTLLFSVVFFGTFYWFYSYSRERALEAIQTGLTASIQGAAAGIDGDEFDALVRQARPNAQGTTDDPRYGKILAWLDTVHSMEPRAFPYTYVAGPDKDGQRTNYFVV